MQKINDDTTTMIANPKLSEHKSFTSEYSSLRSKEGRIYPDEIVARLPIISTGDKHYFEWRIRQKSFKRLKKYLQKKQKPLKILEVGCGNGWLSHHFSCLPGSQVTGIDINQAELQQARRVFKERPNLHFVTADLFSEEVIAMRFDIIVFAASLQYFPVLDNVIRGAKKLLKPEGEIHILDTHLYKTEEVEEARQRSKKYYEESGLPALSEHYFHHSLSGLETFNYSILYKPSWIQLLLRDNPFTWVRIN